MQGVNPEFSACCDTSLFPDLSPSSVVSFDNELLDKVSVDFSGSNDMNEASAGSLEAEIAVNSLRRALTQVLLSTDVDHQSKKLIDASMRIIVDDFLAIPQERDRIAQLISVKNYVLSMCVFLWIVVLAIAFFVRSGVKSSFTRPWSTCQCC